ncbi:MAG: tripartite tricarboxylate transporter permease [Oceanospirillaceae bacterium]|nr:tripartite tricarboxylate transporter permease [Oceanospirillaceae bacterium]
MDILDSILGGLELIADPSTAALMVFGTLCGIVVGIIPGLSATMAIALLIPFTFTMDPVVAMALLVVVYVGGISGGALTAILIRMPGTPSSVATVLDGYPMTQNGQAGKAIGNAVVASFVGTVVSGCFLMAFAPTLARFAVQFFYSEYVAVCLFALAAVVSVSGKSLLRGLVTMTLGMLAATFGMSEVDGLPRFTFGISEFNAGFSLIPALIGFFAISQIMKESMADNRDRLKPGAMVIGRMLPSFSDIYSNIGNYIRSSLIGTLIGVLPAMGGAPAALISYAQAKNASKTPERFGKGAVEGIIASETANNATIGGALIIALTLGIPGDPATAILIGGLMIHGLQPGPQLFTQTPEVVYAIYLAVFFGSIVMMIAMLTLSRYLCRLVDLPKEYFLPILFIVAATGVYSMNNRMFDVGVMVGFGVLGYLFERMRYPLAPFVLGMLLGPIIEDNFRRLVEVDGHAWGLFTRPISLAFLIAAALFLAFSIWKHHQDQQKSRDSEDAQLETNVAKAEKTL